MCSWEGAEEALPKTEQGNHGPMQVELKGGGRYMVTSTDDLSLYTTAYFIKAKSEVLLKFMECVPSVEKHTGCSHEKSIFCFLSCFSTSLLFALIFYRLYLICCRLSSLNCCIVYLVTFVRYF